MAKRTSIYQIKITIVGSKPPIWRRLLVPSSIKLSQLHHVIQAVMEGWTDSHLHQFQVGNEYYGVANSEYGDDFIDEKKIELEQVLSRIKGYIVYEYDFGDSWQHKIELEKILPPDPATTIPFCIKGKRACPQEDIGGIWGYQEYLDAIADKNHPKHDDYIEWAQYDPEKFDIDRVNQELSQLNIKH